MTELVQKKTPRVLAGLPDAGAGWTVHYVLFGRSGFTEAAQAEAAGVGARLLGLEQLERGLAG